MDPRIYRRMAEVEDSHWWFTVRRQILDRMIAGLELAPGARLLEVGCGTGGNLPMLARHGETYAMESDAAAIDYARRRQCARVQPGRLPEAIPFGDLNFDLVLMSDVLEHLEREEDSLRAVRARLKAGGWLLITVPALPALWSRHDEAHHHRRRYRLAGLRSLVGSAGYEVRYVSYFNSVLLPAIFAARRLRGLLAAGGDGHDLAMPPASLNRMLAALFGIERRLVGRVTLPAGVSLILLARRAG